ncbi:hypothetical protein LIS82_12045 [Cytobacillus solani]|uniref:hypothetical protein n=1 Tax=Cytobacillus solani TaxID=1637975 RepID=UPI00207964E6|nr:hypothetical protein [Cytobacillus solani]USK57145.1 hypothetical protein LIS82_12045 [Cytobacillus solani]
MGKMNILLGLMLVLMVVYLYYRMVIDSNFNTESPEDYITHEYVIVDKTSEGYTGESVDNDNVIFFTHDKLQPDQIINVGDNVICYFKESSKVDGLIKIDKVK